MKSFEHRNTQIFHSFLLVVIIVVAAIWALEEYLEMIVQRDRYGYIACLVVLPCCLFISYVKKQVNKIRIFVYFFLAFYLIFLSTTSFIHSAMTGNMYYAVSSIQWVPTAYIVAFLFLPMRLAVITVIGFYSLMVLLLLISYTGVFPEVSNELHALYINAIFAQGLYILCLLGVIQLRAAKQEATNYANQMEKAANIDGLLGIGNRRMLQYELDKLAANKTSFSLLLIDVDYFKAINDTHGHLIGDDILRALSICIQKNLGTNDLLGRWGGEEFLIVAKETELKEAELLAEKIRKAVESTMFDTVGKVTVSIGVNQFQVNAPVSHAFSQADKALYQAKKSGRNKVVANFDQ